MRTPTLTTMSLASSPSPLLQNHNPPNLTNQLFHLLPILGHQLTPREQTTTAAPAYPPSQLSLLGNNTNPDPNRPLPPRIRNRPRSPSTTYPAPSTPKVRRPVRYLVLLSKNCRKILAGSNPCDIPVREALRKRLRLVRQTPGRSPAQLSRATATR